MLASEAEAGHQIRSTAQEGTCCDLECLNRMHMRINIQEQRMLERLASFACSAKIKMVKLKKRKIMMKAASTRMSGLHRGRAPCDIFCA